jgi:hypothetical protein
MANYCRAGIKSLRGTVCKHPKRFANSQLLLFRDVNKKQHVSDKESVDYLDFGLDQGVQEGVEKVANFTGCILGLLR